MDIRQTETFRTARENDHANGVRRFWDALAIAFDGVGSSATDTVRSATGSVSDFTDALEAMTDGYLEALLWTAYVDTGDPEDAGEETYQDAGYTTDDVTGEFRARVFDHLLSVVVAHPLAVRFYGARRSFSALGPNTVARAGEWDYFGHDYLLTRDGHGVGFWDRGLAELGEYLTTVAKDNGASEYANGGLQVTADGKIDA